VALVHVIPAGAGPDITAALGVWVPREHSCPDLDRALERAENHLLQVYATNPPPEATSLMEAMALFNGLDERDRTLLESRMSQRLFRAGETVVSTGEPGDSLMIVLHGSASVMVTSPSGSVRVAGMRRGAIIGEVAFLDRAPRSATVIAHDELVVAVLDRDAYDALSRESPVIVQKMLANVALYLAARLRHTTQLAAARYSQPRV
jgi:CRP-like cAMP-binding protein